MFELDKNNRKLIVRVDETNADVKMEIHFYGFRAWNPDARARCVVTLIDPDEWFKLTRTPPDPPATQD